MDTVRYRKVNVDGINLFYREAGRRKRERFSCCTAFPPLATCSEISFRNSGTGLASSLPTHAK